MIWLLAGALFLSLLYVGRVLLCWKATNQLAYLAGWKAAMELRDTWDKNRTVDAISDEMLRQSPNRKNLHLVN